LCQLKPLVRAARHRHPLRRYDPRRSCLAGRQPIGRLPAEFAPPPRAGISVRLAMRVARSERHRQIIIPRRRTSNATTYLHGVYAHSHDLDADFKFVREPGLQAKSVGRHLLQQTVCYRWLRHLTYTGQHHAGALRETTPVHRNPPSAWTSSKDIVKMFRTTHRLNGCTAMAQDSTYLVLVE